MISDNFSLQLNTAIWGNKPGTLLFLPSEEYKALEKNSIVMINRVLRSFSEHVGIKPPEIQFWLGVDYVGTRKLGHYRDGTITLKRNSNVSGKTFAAILAHEFAHYYLDTKNIIIGETMLNYSDELLTDKTIFFLGLGHLSINGKNAFNYSAGYLNMESCILNYQIFGKINGISDELLNKHLDHIRVGKDQAFSNAEFGGKNIFEKLKLFIKLWLRG